MLREYAGWAGRARGSEFVVVGTLQSAYLGQGVLRLFGSETFFKSGISNFRS